MPAAYFQLRLTDGSHFRIQYIARHTFRIRISPSGDFREPPLNRYGILQSGAEAPDWEEVEDGSPDLVLQTAEISVRIDRHTGSLQFVDGSGAFLTRTVQPPRSRPGGGFEAAFLLADSEKIYGLGDSSYESIQKRGHTADLQLKRNVTHVPVPYLMSSAGWGLLINTTYKHTADIGRSDRHLLALQGSGGEFDVYWFAGSSYGQLLERYTRIAGRPRLLPIWAYGLTFLCNQYANAREVIEDGRNFRREDIPCDLLGLEPGWMEKHYDYSTSKNWHPERFSIPFWNPTGPRTFISTLKRMGFKISLWLNCRHDLTSEEERRLSGTPAASVEPWYDHLKKFVDQGISAFKLDGCFLDGTFEPDRWANGMSTEELHHLYVMLLAKQMHQGYADQTGQRPLLFSMTGYTGIQSYAVNWTIFSGEDGDKSMVTLMNHAMSGQPYAVSDMDVFSPAGIHLGFLQTLSLVNSFAYWGHPSLLDESLMEMYRRYAKLRYQLLPYLYTAAQTAASTGMPVLRPFPLAFPDDPRSDGVLHQYMLGDSLLVAAFTEQVYLPEGVWIDYWTGDRHIGPQDLAYTPPKEAGGPLFVRAGAIIPVWPPLSHIQPPLPERIGLHVYPHGHSTFRLYEDDGISHQYLQNRYAFTEIHCQADRRQVSVTIGLRVGEYDGMPDNRSYDLYVHIERKPMYVMVNGSKEPEITRRPDPSALAGGWYFDRAALQVHLYLQEDTAGRKPLRIDIFYDAPEQREGGKGPARRSDRSNRSEQEETRTDSVPQRLESELEISLLAGQPQGVRHPGAALGPQDGFHFLGARIQAGSALSERPLREDRGAAEVADGGYSRGRVRSLPRPAGDGVRRRSLLLAAARHRTVHRVRGQVPEGRPA